MMKKSIFLVTLLSLLSYDATNGNFPLLAQDTLSQRSRTIVQGTLTTITGIKLNTTDNKLEIVLETPEQSNLQPLIFPQDNTLVIDILDAVLTLPDEQQDFKAENPTDDISEVTVTQLDSTSIRITITGKNNVPTAQVVPSERNLILSLTPSAETPESTEEIEIFATQEEQEDRYLVPNASTATGTDTPIIETPFSVQVVPEAVIREQQAININEVLRNVSGVIPAGTNGGREAGFSIRGFGGQAGNTAPVLRDGYRIYGNFQGIPEISNLERVEVLKGPASILYGQVEPGGVINLVSKKPLSEPFAELELQLGNRGLVRPRFDFSGSLNPSGSLRYRLNGLYRNEASFRDFDQEFERFSVAPIVTYNISDRTDLALSVEYIKDTNPADFGLSSFGDGVAPVPRSRVINDPSDFVDTDYVSAGYGFEHRFNDNWKIRNGFRYISYNYDFSVVALPIAVNGPTVTRFFADQDGKDRSFSVTTNVVGEFATGSIEHKFLGGIDYNHGEDRIISLIGNPAPLDVFNPDYSLFPKPDRSALSPFNNTFNSSNRVGIYLQDQIYFLDNLILVAGLRYDTVTQKTTNAETNFTTGSVIQQTDDALTPRIGLLYRPIPEISLFANYSQSFEPSTEITATGEIIEPERGEGFEFGVKTELFDQRLLATLTYFNITKQNVPVQDPNNPFFFIATGEQQSQGFELDIVGEILPGWKIIAAYAYIDAKVTEDTNTALIDNRLFGIPYNAASLWTTYEIQQGVLQGLGFGLGLSYVGDRFGDLANTYTVGDYIIGNAAIFYQRDRYSIALNFKNIADASYIQSVAGTNTGIEPGEPFTVIGSFSVRF